MEEQYWKRFEETGRIEDYLTYRGMQLCLKAMEYREGSDGCESDHRDRHGASQRTDRGI